jgi:hypothetical protein
MVGALVVAVEGAGPGWGRGVTIVCRSWKESYDERGRGGGRPPRVQYGLGEARRGPAVPQWAMGGGPVTGGGGAWEDEEEAFPCVPLRKMVPSSMPLKSCNGHLCHDTFFFTLHMPFRPTSVWFMPFACTDVWA